MASMSMEDRRERVLAITSRLGELTTDYQNERFSDEATKEWNDLHAEREEHEATIEEVEARMRVLDEISQKPESREQGATFSVRSVRTQRDIYDLSEIRSQSHSPDHEVELLRDNALRAVEESRFELPAQATADAMGTPLPRKNVEDVQQRIGQLVDADPHGEVSRRILQTGSNTYKRAFGKAISNRNLLPEEERALNVVTTGGGYAIPFALDPTFIHVSNYSVNPYRAICRNVSITGSNTWQGVTTTGVTAGRIIEGGTAADNAPSFLQPQGQVTRVHCFIPYSLEVEGDIQGLAGELTSLFSEAKDDEEALNFTTGTGTAPAPVGILGAGGGLGTAAPPKVLCGGTAAFAVGDIDNAQVTLAPRWRSRASWVGNLGFYQRVRRFYTAGGETLTQMLGPGNEAGFQSVAPGGATVGYNLLGRPAYECSQINTTNVLTSGTKLAVFGDFSKFIIVDRVGMNIEAVPLLMTSSLPTGNRGLYAWWRNTTVLATGTGAGAFVYLQTT
jgi:HK97 family phage major capsid protein